MLHRFALSSLALLLAGCASDPTSKPATQSKTPRPQDVVTLRATTTRGDAFMWDPEVLDLINTAERVYASPVTTALAPRLEERRMRLLVGQARREIVALLGRKRTWYVGHYTIVHGDVPPRSLGLVFRRGTNELVLFFLEWGGSENKLQYVEGTFNGRSVADELEEKPARSLLKWAQRYAKTELTTN